jgi:hypothetical protein
MEGHAANPPHSESQGKLLYARGLPSGGRTAYLRFTTPMKKFLTCFVASALLAPGAVFAAAFEGKVNFALSTGRGQPQQISYSLKGDKIRIEMPGQKGMGGLIMDPVKKETLIIMDEQKMYMVMAMPDVQAQAAEAKPGDVKLEKTGQKEKILGYDTEKYISTYQDTTTELWLAEGLGTFMSFSQGNPMAGRGGGGAQPSQAWERALAGKELFPLRVTSKDKSGKETLKMEATAINKQTLSDSLFTPPAGYQKLDMGGMMKGMMPGVGR